MWRWRRQRGATRSRRDEATRCQYALLFSRLLVGLGVALVEWLVARRDCCGDGLLS